MNTPIFQGEHLELGLKEIINNPMDMKCGHCELLLKAEHAFSWKYKAMKLARDEEQTEISPALASPFPTATAQFNDIRRQRLFQPQEQS